MYAEEKDVLKYDHMAEDEVPQEENQTKKDSWTDRAVRYRGKHDQTCK